MQLTGEGTHEVYSAPSLKSNRLLIRIRRISSNPSLHKIKKRAESSRSLPVSLKLVSPKSVSTSPMRPSSSASAAPLPIATAELPLFSVVLPWREFVLVAIHRLSYHPSRPTNLPMTSIASSNRVRSCFNSFNTPARFAIEFPPLFWNNCAVHTTHFARRLGASRPTLKSDVAPSGLTVAGCSYHSLWGYH